MELQQLRYILALARERNFIRAARVSHVTQPTLSHQIRKLEEEIGQPLFERSSQGVRLTSAGETFIPYAQSVLDQLDQGLTEIREDAGIISGTIKLGAIPTIAPYLLPDIISELKKEAPSLHLEIYEETTSMLVQSIKDGKIDLGVLSLPIEDAGLVSRELGSEEFFLAMPRQHPLARKKSIKPSEIKKEKMLILQEGHCFSDQALEYCERIREDAQVIFQGSSLTSVMKLAAAGEGLTLVPEMAVSEKENPKLTFVPFTRPRPTRVIGIIWRVSAPLTNAHRYFIQNLERAFKISQR